MVVVVDASSPDALRVVRNLRAVFAGDARHPRVATAIGAEIVDPGHWAASPGSFPSEGVIAVCPPGAHRPSSDTLFVDLRGCYSNSLGNLQTLLRDCELLGR
jgi:hypothetical protein